MPCASKACGVGPQSAGGENHRADVLGGRGFEQVGAAAGAVAHVVAHEVGDHRRVAGIVLRDAASTLPTRSAPTSAALV